MSDSALIEVLPPDQDSQSGHVVLFPVRLLDSLSVWERDELDLYVELSNRRTGQKARIPVFIKLIGDKPELPREFDLLYQFHVGGLSFRDLPTINNPDLLVLSGWLHFSSCTS